MPCSVFNVCRSSRVQRDGPFSWLCSLASALGEDNTRSRSEIGGLHERPPRAAPPGFNLAHAILADVAQFHIEVPEQSG
jgi:hypothetical protein